MRMALSLRMRKVLFFTVIASIFVLVSIIVFSSPGKEATVVEEYDEEPSPESYPQQPMVDESNDNLELVANVLDPKSAEAEPVFEQDFTDVTTETILPIYYGNSESIKNHFVVNVPVTEGKINFDTYANGSWDTNIDYVDGSRTRVDFTHLNSFNFEKVVKEFITGFNSSAFNGSIQLVKEGNTFDNLTIDFPKEEVEMMGDYKIYEVNYKGEMNLVSILYLTDSPNIDSNSYYGYLAIQTNNLDQEELFNLIKNIKYIK